MKQLHFFFLWDKLMRKGQVRRVPVLAYSTLIVAYVTYHMYYMIFYTDVNSPPIYHHLVNTRKLVEKYYNTRYAI